MHWISTALAALAIVLCGPASALDFEQTHFGIALNFGQDARPAALAIGVIDATRDATDTDVKAQFPRTVAPLLSYDFHDDDLALSPGLRHTWLGSRIELFIAERHLDP